MSAERHPHAQGNAEQKRARRRRRRLRDGEHLHSRFDGERAGHVYTQRPLMAWFDGRGRAPWKLPHR